MRKLRKQEAWVKQREQKLAKMKRTGTWWWNLGVFMMDLSSLTWYLLLLVDRLKRRHKNAYGRSNNLSGSESGSDGEDDEPPADWSDYSSQSELASTLEKLERLEEELASDAGSFSEESPQGPSDRFRGSDFHAVYHVPPSPYALQRDIVPYRYPLASSSAVFAPRRTISCVAGDGAGQDARWMRSQRTAFGLR